MPRRARASLSTVYSWETAAAAAAAGAAICGLFITMPCHVVLRVGLSRPSNPLAEPLYLRYPPLSGYPLSRSSETGFFSFGLNRNWGRLRAPKRAPKPKPKPTVSVQIWPKLKPKSKFSRPLTLLMSSNLVGWLQAPSVDC